ncbi:MAG: 4-vinyl reductase [Candidatus Methanofastidiosia archaeon]|jgi:predicted hydrocarbon binding protein
MHEEVKTDNLIMRVFLETIENIIGPNGLKSVLNYAHLEKYIDHLPPDNDEKEIPSRDLHSLYLALYQMFGGKGAHSLQLRVGRENVYRGLKKRPGIAKTMKMASRLVPEITKMRLALERLEGYMKGASSNGADQSFVEITEQEDCFLFIQRDSIESDGITSETPICGVSQGIMEALIEWITGHTHKVEEIECRATGCSADVFKIWKAHQKD